MAAFDLLNIFRTLDLKVRVLKIRRGFLSDRHLHKGHTLFY